MFLYVEDFFLFAWIKYYSTVTRHYTSLHSLNRHPYSPLAQQSTSLHSHDRPSYFLVTRQIIQLSPHHSTINITLVEHSHLYTLNSPVKFYFLFVLLRTVFTDKLYVNKELQITNVGFEFQDNSQDVTYFHDSRQRGI